MVLVDTSVWIAHLRRGEQKLADHLSNGLVLMHPGVAGELACGNLADRDAVLSDLFTLPSAELASDSEVFSLIEERKFWGRGLGWVDLHLLASSLLSACRFWTFDKRLEQVAHDLGLT